MRPHYDCAVNGAGSLGILLQLFLIGDSGPNRYECKRFRGGSRLICVTVAGVSSSLTLNVMYVDIVTAMRTLLRKTVPRGGIRTLPWPLTRGLPC